jgi:hypothetical protein
MSIPEYAPCQLQHAVARRRLRRSRAVECADAMTGEPRYVICAIPGTGLTT